MGNQQSSCISSKLINNKRQRSYSNSTKNLRLANENLPENCILNFNFKI